VEVRVRHFSVLREQRGTAEETVNVEPGTTVRALYAELFPPGRDGALPVLFAVNRAYVGPQHVLVAGDELAFIPPLGGG
jgi:molybdopterin converting factor small subunit